jgi:hypothetical protein
MDKRRKELIFLGAGLLVLLAALYFTFKPSTRAAQAVPQSQAAAPATESAAPTAAAPSAQISPAPAPLLASESATSAGRNPFAPAVSNQAAAAPQGAPPPMMTAMARPLPPIQPMPLRLFGPDASAAAPTAPASPQPGVSTPAAAAPPAEPPLSLTGVIYGDPSMAIIRKGSQRYYVRPGDPVGGRYIVRSISNRRVVLASSQGTLSLDLSGRL